MVENGYTFFKQNYKATKNEKWFPPPLILCSKFFVSWSAHGTLIIILIMDPSFSSDDSNLNGRTLLQQNLTVLNL